MNTMLDFVKRNNLYINVILVGLVIVLGLIILLLSFKYREISSSMYAIAKPLIQREGVLASGDVGEVMIKDQRTGEEKALVTGTMPPVIFNTTGIILEVNKGSLKIQGSGSNFADKTSRTLTVIFTDSTLTFEKNPVNNYEGGAGFLHISPGMKILIEGEENIRGKTEIQAKRINIL